MDRSLKVVLTLLLGAFILGLAGCAATSDTSTDPLTPSESPSKDDASHGWGPNPAQ